MNMLAKDKYRKKVLQNVLQSPDHHSSFDDDVHETALDKNFDATQNMKNQGQNIHSSKIFEKVSKQKPLISDTGDLPALRDTKNDRKSMSTVIAEINSYEKNRLKQTINQTNRSKDPLSFFNECRPQNHLHRESYTYHQKLPVMSVSNEGNEEVLKKLKVDKKKKQTAYFEDKENDSKDMNHVKVFELKEKKYKFIPAFKVAEVKRKKEEQKKDKMVSVQMPQPEQNVNIQIDEIDAGEEEANELGVAGTFNETQRSKGSKQMMDFLESARDKLFSSMKALQFIEIQNDHHEESQPEQVMNSSHLKPSSLKKFAQQQNFVQSLPSFKIQIEVSAKKTCQLDLTLTSDPSKISQAFILSNKSELSTFTDTQLKKLQSLLSKKISLQIQKQQSLYENQIKNSHRNHLNNTKNFQNYEPEPVQIKNDKKTANQETTIEGKKGNKNLHFSHVYIETIEPQVIPTNQQQIPNFTRLVSFNPKTNCPSFEETEKQKISLEGYLNSPHQLITYRPDSNQQSSHNLSNRTLQNSNSKNQNNCSVSHFPITSFPHENSKSKTFTDSEQIGASKILSKSRSKTLQKLKNQLQPAQKQIISSQITDQPKGIKPSEHSFPEPVVCGPSKTSRNNSVSGSRCINPISSQIIQRVGKQKILQCLKEKELSRRESILKEKEEKERELLEQCSFKPLINKVSKSIDENKKQKIKIGELVDEQNGMKRVQNLLFFSQKVVEQKFFGQDESRMKLSLSKSNYHSKQKSRYEQLYDNHKQMEAKKQYSRKKSIEQISFKPEINKISKKIIETKRNSLNNSTSYDYSMSNSVSRHQTTCKKPQKKRNSYHCANDVSAEIQGMNQKRKSMNVSRNLEGLEIGEYLYKEAMRLKKKKETAKQAPTQNFKPLPKSQQIVNKIKQNKLRECFYELLNVECGDSSSEYEFVLKPEFVDLEDEKFSKTHLKYLVPLLEELKQLEASLTLEEFVQSGLNLLGCLSQEEKGEFLSKKGTGDEFSEWDEKRGHMNRVSRKMMERRGEDKDIYERGVAFRRQVREKREGRMEERVRKELEKCTFKPRINANGGGREE